MRAHDAQAGNVAVLYTVGGLLLHLGQDIADNLGVVVGRLLGTGDIDGDEAELRPREGVVEVVLEKVILGQVLEVGVLNEWKVGWSEESDIHGGRITGLRLEWVISDFVWFVAKRVVIIVRSTVTKISSPSQACRPPAAGALQADWSA